MPPLSAAVLVGAALASAACARAPAFSPYADPAGHWTVSVPAGWTADPKRENRAGSAVEFVGAATPQDEGYILGAVLTVSRLNDHAKAPSSDTFSAEFDHAAADIHGGAVTPMRAEGFVVRTPAADYVVEYRATKKDFERYRYALDRARATFSVTDR